MSASSRVHPDRVRALHPGTPGPGPVIHWLRRDQRAQDNWALLHAQDLALAAGRPLAVAFCLVPEFLGAARRQYAFMLTGLRETARELADLRIPFFLLRGDPVQEVPALLERTGAGVLVTDFNPLHVSRRWEQGVCGRVAIPVHVVDAHNVVPVWRASDKQEYAARTIRPRLQRQLPEFLTDIPPLRAHPVAWPGDVPLPDWEDAGRGLAVGEAGAPVAWCTPGPRAAGVTLTAFLERRLAGYDTARNDPNADGQSGLSPYLHFGHLAPQRAAFAAAQRPASPDREAFLEELIVRRELSDNFCHHNPHYDQYEGLPAWARRTLEDHLDDEREHLYDLEEFESARTHDALWNAAQTELTVRGKMHGYLRMYWAKKILEWTRDPGEALDVAITLNDRYELDGRDPSGYVGCAWSVGGLHDRPWTERPIFGKVRYMNLNGCKRKFRVDRYIDRMARLRREAGA